MQLQSSTATTVTVQAGNSLGGINLVAHETVTGSVNPVPRSSNPLNPFEDAFAEDQLFGQVFDQIRKTSQSSEFSDCDLRNWINSLWS